MGPEIILQLLTPTAIAVWIYMQQRESAKIAAKVAEVAKETAADVKTELAKSASKRDEKLKQIHDLVNGEMTKAHAKLDEQRLEITKLKEWLADARKNK